MDRMLDIEKGEHRGDGFKWYRFQCECSSAEDILDISVESYGKDDNGKFITMTLNLRQIGLLERIKDAIRVLRGHICWREFIPREDDYCHMSKILNPDTKYSDLP